MKNKVLNGLFGAGLFRRIYLHSLLLIVLIMMCVGLLFHALGPQHNFLNIINQLSRTITDQIDFQNNTRAELEELLEELHQVTAMSFALVGRDDKIYAQAGNHQLSPLAANDVTNLFEQDQATYLKPGMLALPLTSKTGQPDAYLLVKIKKDRYHWSLLLSLLAVFLLIAVASIPLARTIARPLEKLTHTTSLFASGQLDARTGIDSKDEIGVLAQNMDQMACKLANRIRAEKELLANVSHEFRTPLSRIKVALALCSEDDSVTVAQLQQQLVGIEGDVADLELLIQDVMDVARYDLSENNGDNSNFRLRKSPVDLTALAAASKERFESLEYAHTLSVSNEKIVSKIQVDPALIKRVIDNLLDNAAKYSPPESTIELRVTQTSGGQQIVVGDRGIGIAQEDLINIFEPFFRTDRSRNRGTGGTGLGLALCKRIVAAHGGTISVKSSDTTGTEFIVELPA